MWRTLQDSQTNMISQTLPTINIQVWNVSCYKLSYLVEHQLIVSGVDTAFKSLDGWDEKKKNDSVIVYKLTKLLWRQHFAFYHHL